VTTGVSTGAIVAAGAVCWREVDGKLRVLLIHRGDRADISLPKGKVDPGETLPETAVREIEEETGLSVTLGAPLGSTEYPMPSGRDKIVHYWTAEVSDVAAAAPFTPNAEVARLEWSTPREARQRLTYPRDRELLDRFTTRAAAGQLRTFALVALRHGKAVPAGSWTGPDSTRPLDALGVQQAQSSARAIAAFRPTKLISSPAARCMSTIEPVARLLGLDIKATRAISQDSYEDGVAEVERVVRRRVQKAASSVLCSHGPVLPDILEQIAVAAHSPVTRAIRRAALLDTGDFSVMHLAPGMHGAQLVAFETHRPA
jgi:8-oxo-dGTP diphosphatase